MVAPHTIRRHILQPVLPKYSLIFSMWLTHENSNCQICSLQQATTHRPDPSVSIGRKYQLNRPHSSCCNGRKPFVFPIGALDASTSNNNTRRNNRGRGTKWPPAESIGSIRPPIDRDLPLRIVASDAPRLVFRLFTSLIPIFVEFSVDRLSCTASYPTFNSHSCICASHRQATATLIRILLSNSRHFEVASRWRISLTSTLFYASSVVIQTQI